jgi:hypothetical protein
MNTSNITTDAARALGLALAKDENNAQLLELIEGLIDGLGLGERQGVSELLTRIGDVTDIKAVHVMEAWQDTSLSRRWEATGDTMRNLAIITKKRFG